MPPDARSVRVVTKAAALLLCALAARWLYVYVFTDYRHHLAAYFVGLAMIVAAFAIGLWFQRTVAVVTSVVIGAVTFAGAAYLLLAGGVSNPFVWVVAIASAAYTGAVGVSLLHGVYRS